MPTVSYHTLAGRIALTTVGTNRQECLPDALGSVVTTTIGGAATGKQIRYANYGGVIYDVGGFNRPRNAWVGSYGYRSTQVSHAEQYVRARHYSTAEARWTTVDPLWPHESAYGYVRGKPVLWADPSGTTEEWDMPGCKAARQSAYNSLSKCFDPKVAQALATIMQCIAYGEASVGTPCSPTADNGSGAHGLYQLGKEEINRCCPPGCSLRTGETQIGCNTAAAIGEMLRLFANPTGSSTVGDKLCRYWGVLDCPDEDRKRQNDKTLKCLKAKKIYPHSMPVPKPKPGCDPCS